MSLMSLVCNRCGAALEVEPGTRFVACTQCGARLQVQVRQSAAFTIELDEPPQPAAGPGAAGSLPARGTGGHGARRSHAEAWTTSPEPDVLELGAVERRHELADRLARLDQQWEAERERTVRRHGRVPTEHAAQRVASGGWVLLAAFGGLGALVTVQTSAAGLLLAALGVICAVPMLRHAAALRAWAREFEAKRSRYHLQRGQLAAELERERLM